MNNNIITIGTALKWRGIFDKEKVYYQDNMVLEAGCIFRCKVLQTVNQPPVKMTDGDGHFELINQDIWDVILDMSVHYNKIADIEHYVGVTDSETLTGLLTALKTELQASINGKVDKVTGKGLSTNDYTDTDKAKLTALPTNTQLTQDLASKLNASVWNDAHEQFSIEGSYWSYRNGKVVSDAVWKRTPRIPLNRDAPIILKNVSQSGNAATCFFDEGGNFISAVKGAHGALATIEPSAYPDKAVFVGISTRIEEDTTYSNGDTVEARESAVAEAIAASKLAAFVDLWTRCYDCQYDPTKAKPFSCNGVELTYQEALDVYNAPRIAYPYFTGANQLTVSAKTLILSSRYAPGSNANLKHAFYNGAYTVIRIASDVDILWVSNSGRAFGYCQQLEKILGAMRLETTTSNEIFFQCDKLQEVKINHLSLNISFHHSPLLSLASLTYLVTYAANTSTITVTVHPDVYAKLTGDTTNAAAAALSADELAQWQSLVSAAAAKNISFATV